jgi:AbrB family looped-hinge helix DNA binding protein
MAMSMITISSKFQVPVPKVAREMLHLRSGQKMAVIVKAGGLHYVPVPSIGDIQKELKGMKTDDIREDEDRAL